MRNDDTTNIDPTPAGDAGTPGTSGAIPPPGLPPAHPTPSGPRFRLRRSPDDVMLAGVCSGVAEELDLDPALVRIAVVVLTVLSGGGAALVYLAAWILAPVRARV